LTGYALQTFLRWGQSHKITEPGQLDQRVLDRYDTFLPESNRTPIGRPLSRASVRTCIRTLGTFFVWCQAENEVSANVKVLNYAGHKAGIERRIHPHLFRHSLVTGWPRAHTNPVSLQHILGWK
jgi:site-specific recombinase XerD